MNHLSILSGSAPQEGKIGYPKLLVLSGPPGVGKSSLSQGLNVKTKAKEYKNLVIDFQSGLSHVGGNVFDLRAFQEDFKTTPLKAYKSAINQLKNLKKGIKVTKTAEGNKEEKIEPFEWDFITIDPLSYLQPILTELSADKYNRSVIGVAKAKDLAEKKYGKAYTPAHVVSMYSTDPVGDPDNNAGQNGWKFMKDAWTEIFYELLSLPKECLIVVAHNKYNKLNKVDGTSIDVKALDFWPTYAAQLIAEAHDSAAVVRSGNEVYLNFALSAENEVFKSRNFGDQNILISKKEGDNIEFYWDKIFPFLKA